MLRLLTQGKFIKSEARVSLSQGKSKHKDYTADSRAVCGIGLFSLGKEAFAVLFPTGGTCYLLGWEAVKTEETKEVYARIGVIGIVIENPEKGAQDVNKLLSRYSRIIKGRMGLPFTQQNIAVISLIVQGNTDDIGALTGSLGRLEGVTVKSALTSKSLPE